MEEDTDMVVGMDGGYKRLREAKPPQTGQEMWDAVHLPLEAHWPATFGAPPLESPENWGSHRRPEHGPACTPAQSLPPWPCPLPPLPPEAPHSTSPAPSASSPPRLSLPVVLWGRGQRGASSGRRSSGKGAESSKPLAGEL